MIVELHLLQNLAPSCLNRDDANAPKDCEFGGYRRARISSQCIKRSIREEFKNSYPENTGIRSKQASERLSEKLAYLLPQHSNEELKAISADIISEYYAKAGKNDGESSVLIFFDDSELGAIANEAAKVIPEMQTAAVKSKAKKGDDSPWKKFAKENNFKPSSFDIALFGRMLAEQPGKNIDGACQVAHAISTNRVMMENDFFTAVDDLQSKEQAGAGMMGTIGFNSSCFYRYAVINIDKLTENLGGNKEAARNSVKAFISASFTAMPTGKQNSFAAHNPPSFGFAVVRDNNTPWSLANAFEKPIMPAEKRGIVAASIESLSRYWKSLGEIYVDQLKLKGAAAVMISTSDTEGFNNELLASYKKNSIKELLDFIDNLFMN